MSSFIDAKDFAVGVSHYRPKKDITTWSDLTTQAKIFKVISLEERKSKFGTPCWVTIIKDKEENQLKIFAPKLLVLRIKEERPEGTSPFFIALGQEVGEEGRKYNSFDLLFQKDTEALQDLFITKK